MVVRFRVSQATGWPTGDGWGVGLGANRQVSSDPASSRTRVLLVLDAGEMPSKRIWVPGSASHFTYYHLPLDDGLFATQWGLHPGSYHTPGPHPSEKQDCTHYCWVPTLWHVVWEQLALVLEHHRGRREHEAAAAAEKAAAAAAEQAAGEKAVVAPGLAN
jgi:hypothetical protein